MTAPSIKEALVSTLASLAAAISILERTPSAKKAVASDTMFDISLNDYKKALESGRAALATLSPPAGDFAKFANEQIDRISEPRARTKTVLALGKRLGMTKSTIHVYLRGEETFSAEQKEIAVEFFSDEQDKKKAAEERIGVAIRRLSQPEDAILVQDEAAIRADEREKCLSRVCEALLVMADGWKDNPSEGDSSWVALSNAATLLCGKKRVATIRSARDGGAES